MTSDSHRFIGGWAVDPNQSFLVLGIVHSAGDVEVDGKIWWSLILRLNPEGNDYFRKLLMLSEGPKMMPIFVPAPAILGTDSISVGGIGWQVHIQACGSGL